MGTVTFDGIRLTDAESLTPTTPYPGNWTDTGGAAAAQEPDFVYQNTYSVSEKVKGSELGIGFVPSSPIDMSTTKRVAIYKVIVTTVGILHGTANTSAIAEIGSGGRRSAYYRYYVATGATYPANASWLIIAIDPNLSGHADATVSGPVSPSAIDWFAWMATMTASTAKSENVAMDAIDYITNGTGLTITGATSVFQDFADFDEGTKNNRYGICTQKDGVFYVVGVLTIGTSTTVAFSDTNQVVIFPDGYFDTGFCGVDLGLQHESTTIALTACTFVGKGSYGADGGTADTRPDFGVTGTSGSATIDACSFQNFNALVLTAGVTVTDCVFVECESLVQASATISGCTFDQPPIATAVAFLTSDDPELITDSTFISGGTGHAIEITTPGTYDFTNLVFSGYGADASDNASIYNNSSGNVILNASGCTGITVKNGTSATTSVIQSVTLTVNVADEDDNDVQDASVYIQKSSPTTYTSSTGNAQGDLTFVITQTPDADTPASGWLAVKDVSTGKQHWYRYASYSGSTFTLPTKIGPTACTGGGTSTLLQDSVTDFTAINVQAGDTVRNETDGSWAIVLKVTDASNITTTPLFGGSDNTWTSGDNYSFHTLVVAYVSASDTVQVPIMNEYTTALGVATESFNFQSSVNIDIRIRKSSPSGTRYFPVKTTGQIDSGGFSLSVVLTEDNIACASYT
jgi:hypothetical protein